MTPKSAYAHAADRARRLVRLHHGLVNLRRYRIRRDWKARFCEIMHWPKSTLIERVDTKHALIILRPGSQVTPTDFAADALDDLLRSALVLAVSGLDRYVHDRIVQKIIGALKKRQLSVRQEKFSIPAVLALRAAEAVRRATRVGKQVRPANEIRKKIQEIMHQQTFQSWHQIEEAFELIGIKGLKGHLQHGHSNFQRIKDQLNDIVDRRNRIAHEGDLVRHARGGKARRNPIHRNYVDKSLSFLDELVSKLEAIK